MKPSEVIRKAMTHLVDNGWCRNELQNQQGNVCARGAVCKAISGNATSLADLTWDHQLRIRNHHLWVIVDDALSAKAYELEPRVLADRPVSFIVTYNDEIAKDKQDMLNLFEKTALGLEERGE